MQTFQGIAASPGVAIGEALIVDNEGFRIPRRFVTRDAVDDELQRLNNAIESAARRDSSQPRHDLAAARRSIRRHLCRAFANVCARFAVARRIGNRKSASTITLPEYVVSRTLRRYAKVFQNLDGSYLAERAHDIFDIERTLLSKLLGERREILAHLASPAVILAQNLTPGETANLDRRFVLGFATESGGASGHTAIVAKGLEIPAVVGIGGFLADVSGGDSIIVDGDHGRIILNPDEPTLERYQHEVEEHRTLAVRLERELRDLPAMTTDGVAVSLQANIEFPWEVDVCLERSADGIGLYRTEFLYLGVDSEPTEADHYDAYARVIRAMDGRPVCIRTLDLGADKLGQLPTDEEERNPFLGLRSVRLSLKNVPLFRIQLRAILRASALGKVRVMFPLIGTLQELRQCKMVLADAMEDLEEVGHRVRSDNCGRP